MTGKLSVGSPFPEDVSFNYIPYNSENTDLLACGSPIELNVSKEAANKKLVILGVPGAFTPPCTEKHIGPFSKELGAFKQKGVDEIIIVSANDPFVLSAWGKALKLADKVIFASDPNIEFSKKYDLTLDGSGMGIGLRTGRYAIVVNKGKIEYLGVEPNPGEVTVSGADSVLSKL